MQASTSQRRVSVLIGLFLGFSTLALYLPVLRHDFIQYDDQQYVTENPNVQAGLSWHGLAWAFGFHASNWHPLTWLSHMLDCQLYGLNPAGHHLTNVLLHLAITLLLFRLLNRLTKEVWRSAAVAALFAWHPLHVESVAWVAERKDVLCAFFWMLTLLSYISYVAKPGIGRYLATVGLFALCLMAKPMGVTLPFVMLLLDYWPLGRIANCGSRIVDSRAAQAYRPLSWRKLLWEKIPFFALAASACVLTVQAQRHAIVSTIGMPIVQRIPHILASYLHYLGAAFVPRGLAIFYPLEPVVPLGTIILAFVLLALITLLALKFASRRPWFVVGWLWYLGTLVPVIGFVQVGDQAWADRYTYLPLIGLFIAVVWFGAEMIRSPRVLLPVGLAMGAAMLVATSVQLSYWKNTRTLFAHTAGVTRRNSLAITMLGSMLAQEGKLDEAMAQYQKALQYNPDFPEAWFFLGNAFEHQGKTNEAIAAYQKALWYRPIQQQTHIFLGMILGKQLKYDEAAEHYLAALKLDPDSGDAAMAHNNLARLRHTQGRLDEAIEHYQAALAINPKLSLAHNNLGILLLQQGHLTEATRHLREAVRLNPENQESQYNLALALNQQEQWSEAAELFSKTVTANSTDPTAHYEFAVALAHLHKDHDAMAQYAAALLLQPDFAAALNGLSWILATSTNSEFRNGAEAVRMSERACELTAHHDPEKLKTLAAAYAEAGRFPEAIQTARLAEDHATAANRKELADQCRRMREQFQVSKPWREPSAK